MSSPKGKEEMSEVSTAGNPEPEAHAQPVLITCPKCGTRGIDTGWTKLDTETNEGTFLRMKAMVKSPELKCPSCNKVVVWGVPDISSPKSMKSKSSKLRIKQN